MIIKMYINDTYIGFYLIAAIIGLGIGQLSDWMNERLPEKKKIFTREIFRKYKIDFKPNYILMIITAIIYVGLVYKFGIQDTFIGNLNLIKYVLLTPMLLSTFVIDYKKQIIPNRLNLAMFEIGAIITFIYGFSNVAIAIDMLLGMITGVAIFAIIALIGGLFYGKDAMGLGDIKFIGALGLYVGFTNIITISMMAFLIGAIFGIILIIFKRKKSEEYMSFGPFIVIATFISIFIPVEIVITTLKIIFTLGMYKR